MFIIYKTCFRELAAVLRAQEGQATCTLYQIIRGRLRVELQIAGEAQAVVVGYRSAGEMLGETSLLKALPHDHPLHELPPHCRAIVQIWLLCRSVHPSRRSAQHVAASCPPPPPAPGLPPREIAREMQMNSD